MPDSDRTRAYHYRRLRRKKERKKKKTNNKQKQNQVGGDTMDVYVRHNRMPFDEDQTHEFKGHRNIAMEDRNPRSVLIAKQFVAVLEVVFLSFFFFPRPCQKCLCEQGEGEVHPPAGVQVPVRDAQQREGRDRLLRGPGQRTGRWPGGLPPPPPLPNIKSPLLYLPT